MSEAAESAGSGDLDCRGEMTFIISSPLSITPLSRFMLVKGSSRLSLFRNE
jgi:hypothetical protein